MKDIKEYIIEAKKYFKLEEDERQALATFTGILCGDLGDDDERKEFQKVIDIEILSPEKVYYDKRDFMLQE